MVIFNSYVKLPEGILQKLTNSALYSDWAISNTCIYIYVYIK